MNLQPENNPGDNHRLIELFITQDRFIQYRLTSRRRPNRDYINRRAASASGSVLSACTSAPSGNLPLSEPQIRINLSG